MHTLSKNELFLIALELDLVDLLSFCSSDEYIDEKICKNDQIWIYKLNNLKKKYPEIDQIARQVRNTPRKLYELVLDLIKIKDLFKLTKNLYDLYYSENLYLNRKNLKEIPIELGKLVNLKQLDLSNNQIKTIPEELGNLVNLKELDLSNNKIVKIPKSFSNLKKLKSLYLSRNNIKEIPKELAELPKLEKMTVDEKTKIPKEFEDNSRLEIMIF